MKRKQISELQVIAVRYRDSTLAENDERSLDAYVRSGVYGRISAPVTITEPKLADSKRLPAETDNIGLLGGQIAQLVAQARQSEKAILMSGGNCSHITGIFGGLQDAHGPAVKVGLVWFDAHGDFNTVNTTLTGRLGGMPVAVCAGLTYPRWRELSHMVAPLPTDRIVMVDVRNLDVAEEALLRATDVTIARMAGRTLGDVDLETAVSNLATQCDLIYLHIDIDILDERYVPNHDTKEANGPDMGQVLRALETVLVTGKVAVIALVSVYGAGEGAETSAASAIELLENILPTWQKQGMA